jgi:hypothetical protein
LARGVSEETNLSLTILAIFASLGSITRRVQPTLKNTMRKLTILSTATPSTLKLRANSSRVVKPTRVSPTSLFARMSKGAVGPVMATAARAATNFELIHAEMVRRVGI